VAASYATSLTLLYLTDGLIGGLGTRHGTCNYDCLSMAQGIGAIFRGPMASLPHEATET